LVKQNINYYFKNLEIVFCEEHYKLTDLKYEYYNKNEDISNTDSELTARLKKRGLPVQELYRVQI
jgi:hypothetical protein